MKDTLILEGKSYISARRAAKIINYSQDYIGQLCRANKLDCKMVGRSWFVTEESLVSHRASAVDATDERSSKMLKKNIPSTKNIISTISDNGTLIVKPVEKSSIPTTAPTTSIVSNISISPVSPISPIASPISSLKYESHTGPALPEIKKNVPEQFNIKNIFDKTISPFPIKKNTQSTISVLPESINKSFAFNIFLILIIVISITFSSYTLLSPSISKSRNVASTNQASIGSFINNIFNGFKSIGNYITGGSNIGDKGLAKSNIDKNIIDTVSKDIDSKTKSNGVAVSPSSNIEETDLNTKIKIKNSFSDEVNINPDKSGTAGVITPVFKKTNGDDFLYVLVPVKEKKQ